VKLIIGSLCFLSASLAIALTVFVVLYLGTFGKCLDIEVPLVKFPKWLGLQPGT
jgi:hypothetical protein